VVALRPADEPDSPEMVPAWTDPMAVARHLLEERTEDGQMLVRLWRGRWMTYHGPHWINGEKIALEKWIYERLEHAVCQVWNAQRNRMEPKPWLPNRAKVAEVIACMGTITLLDQLIEPPVMLSTGESARHLIPCANGLLDSVTRELLPATPNYFGTVAVPYDYDKSATDLTEWLGFLRSIWPMVDGAEAEEILVLQEWFGYILSGRTDQHKIMLFKGPPRCGKGTIGNILTELIGKANTQGPTLAHLTSNFGLADLIDKSLAVVGDARVNPRNQESILEKLLTISGGDNITADIKNKPAWNGKMGVRFTLLSNDDLTFGDSSAAIASRFLILVFTKSYLGNEDLGLFNRLLPELPAILNWSLDGLDRLRKRGHFVSPESSGNAVEQMRDLASPAFKFVRDVCLLTEDTGKEHSELFDTVYQQWLEWCDKNRQRPGNTSSFSSMMSSAYPSVIKKRPRVPDPANPGKTKRSSVEHYHGLAIKPEPEPDAAPRAHEQEFADHHGYAGQGSRLD
jgi:putative DNA primase/helicase